MKLLEQGWVIRTVPGEKFPIEFLPDGRASTGEWKLDQEVLCVTHLGSEYRFRCSRETYWVGIDDTSLRLFIPTAVGPPRNPKDFPPVASMLWNLTASLASFISDGCRLTTREQYEARLTICDACDQRINNWCRRCGCNLTLKATGRAFQCPLDKWPHVASEKDEP